MPQIYRIKKLGAKVLSKVRHNNGHGVHSPFAFNLITKVINEKGKYYAYDDISAYLTNFNKSRLKPTKFDYLIFRLTNYFSSQNILEIGAGKGTTALFASASSSTCKCTCIETSEQKRLVAKQLLKGWARNITIKQEISSEIESCFDCIIIHLNSYNLNFSAFENQILPLCNDNTFIVFNNIRTKPQHQMLWKKLKQSNEITVTFDLYKTGIIFFNKKLHKSNYRLSF